MLGRPRWIFIQADMSPGGWIEFGHSLCPSHRRKVIHAMVQGQLDTSIMGRQKGQEILQLGRHEQGRLGIKKDTGVLPSLSSMCNPKDIRTTAKGSDELV